MSRRHLTFPCLKDTLVGTLDEGESISGLLIVSGGNETRNGAFAGQSRLAARIAERGYPVFRFDRRGVGDSSGKNAGFRKSSPEIRAAFAQFRKECPHVKRIVAFGNCDAAAALMLGQGYSAKALILANPWTFDDEQSQETPPDAIRARYLEKLRNPRDLARLMTGKVSLRGVAGSLRRAAKWQATTTALGEDMAENLSRFRGETCILLASRDRTALAFNTNYPVGDELVIPCEGADHAFSAPEHNAWLEEQIVSVLEAQA